MNIGPKLRVLEWAFALFAVVLAWQLNIPSAMDSFAIAIGATPNGWLYTVIVDGGIPIILVLISGFAVWLYGRIIWPFVYPEYKGGTWIYSLISVSENAPVTIVGYFHVLHRINSIEILEGHAYYSKKDGIKYRGDWSSSAVAKASSKFSFVFSMKAANPSPEGMPAQYDGYFESEQYKDKPVAGVSCWHGYFQDLLDRRKISGPVYSEHFSKWRKEQGEMMLKHLEGVREGLSKRASLKLPPDYVDKYKTDLWFLNSIS